MTLSLHDFTALAQDLTSGIGAEDRFQRLLTTIHQRLHCDATALLLFEQQQFVPLALNGLANEVMGRRFTLSDHPRLEAIARAGDVVRFPANSDLADPYDGLIPSHQGKLKVHACIGLPLLVNEHLVGALTIDGFDENQFANYSDDDLRAIAALAAASLHSALLQQDSERSAERPAVSHSVEIIGQSVPMQTLKQEIAVVASSDLNALILGETGTGKELVAQAIHKQSARADKEMVYLNCAALPESVAESELFGHVKGAFTGAISNRKGKFELADGGTLFLDEIGELSLPLQAKLLRVLQYGDLQRVGEDKALKIDVRIIAATNRNLKQEVVDGNFRADLYHRLSVFPLSVPPLSERGDDVALLTDLFLERCRSQLALTQLSISDEAQQRLSQNPWPGNVRELEHCIRRAAVIARAQSSQLGSSSQVIIDPQHLMLEASQAAPVTALPAASTPLPAVTDLKQATDAFQRQQIEYQLNQNHGNWSACARALNLDPGNLHRLAKRLGLK
ncbi:nitric oxide reductase transcriptional regulator NorR [Ferrimonas aestuarii]|uniref:Nitric oxide reductase transcriptional regulator NorR n=1 Tax=Ferrimonas aestuarii TaxID=2569539 RepID=A0A4U1BVD5_9GAMM|nr:nitric oxide reductase transcriptional regulator NorR [Ferrimonas aestuarii]TKB56781.1 nitric oxide reductase transcriptional regulator NorR [Ferrimonas aestuarii]